MFSNFHLVLTFWMNSSTRLLSTHTPLPFHFPLPCPLFYYLSLLVLLWKVWTELQPRRHYSQTRFAGQRLIRTGVFGGEKRLRHKLVFLWTGLRGETKLGFLKIGFGRKTRYQHGLLRTGVWHVFGTRFRVAQYD